MSVQVFWPRPLIPEVSPLVYLDFSLTPSSTPQRLSPVYSSLSVVTLKLH